MFYVIIGGAALLSAGVVPLVLMFAYRYYRRISHSRRPLPGDTPVVCGKQQQEKPRLFDVHIKPGLEVDETKFEELLVGIGHFPSVISESNTYLSQPIAVRVTDTNLCEKKLAQQDRPSRSRRRGGAPPETYDVAVLIAMPTPQPRIMERWDELGEYSIGTLKLPAANTLDDP